MSRLFDTIEKLRLTFPGLGRHRGEIFVIKYGGSFMESPDAQGRENVAADLFLLAEAGIRPVVVHGGGKAITKAMENAGLKAEFIQGMRVTDEPAAQVVEQVLSREINPEIVAGLRQTGAAVRGFAGTDIFTCKKLWLAGPQNESVDGGYIGEVTEMKTDPIFKAIAEGAIPVVSPTALGMDGKIYNCNADVAAAHAAMALQAHRLIFMSDVPGLMRDPRDPNSLIKSVTPAQMAEFKKTGIIDKGMIPKTDSAAAAVRAGVKKVSFVDGRIDHVLLAEIFSDVSLGTEIVK